MPQSNNEDESLTTILPAGLAGEVEEYREERGLSKSAAGRELIKEGLRERDKRLQFFRRVTEYVVAIGLAAALVLLVSFVTIVAAGGIGIALGISPWQVLIAGAVAVLVSVIGHFFRVIGGAAWVDRQMNTLSRRLGLER